MTLENHQVYKTLRILMVRSQIAELQICQVPMEMLNELKTQRKQAFAITVQLMTISNMVIFLKRHIRMSLK